MPKTYIINCTKRGNTSSTRPLTIDEAIEYYAYTLETGACYQFEKGNKKINRKPKTIISLISNLNNAVNNAARDGYADVTYAYTMPELVEA